MKEKFLEIIGYVLRFFGISTKDEELDLSSLYWIPKLRMCSYKQHWPLYPLHKYSSLKAKKN